jgi:hypothetical protein
MLNSKTGVATVMCSQTAGVSEEIYCNQYTLKMYHRIPSRGGQMILQ